MAPDDNATRLDRDLIAKNIRRTRSIQGISQTELAKRAGVDLASVWRVEKGIKVRIGTVKKIALGLDVILEDLLLDKCEPDPALHFAIHRAEKAKWYAGLDRRQRIPEDQEDLCQLKAERQRLGKLGLVPWFMCPPLIIPENGPGVVLLEVYEANFERFNAGFYEDGALYVLQGAATVTVAENIVEIGEGDWVAFKTKELSRMAVTPPHEMALLMWIGATRTSKHR